MPFTNGHGLIIGVGDYRHSPRYNVPITVADAQTIANIVQDSQFCGYPAAQVALRTNDNATRNGILDALDRLAQTSAADTVLLFYSGHGDYDTGGNYTLTTHDTRWQGVRVVPGTAISQAELLDKLRAIPAERILLLFNACHAGEISPTLGEEALPPSSPLPDKIANALLATGSGRIVITACREHQYSFIGTGKHTLFAQALAEGLSGGGEVYSRNGFISAFDLYTHLYYALEEALPDAVPQHVRDKYGDKQGPELTVLKGVGPFAVALYRGATTLGDFPADQEPDKDTAVREVPESRSQRALQNITGTATVQGDNSGQSVGVNTGTMNQTRQGIHNDAPNEGAQGNFHGPVSFDQRRTFDQRDQRVQGDQYNAGHDLIHSERDTIKAGGDYVGGDKVGGDQINAQESQGFINCPNGPVTQHYGDTVGGDKVDGDKMSGDQFHMSGNFSGSNLNIKSKLDNVTQSIGVAPQGDEATKAQLQALIEQLSAELRRVPPEQSSDAEAVAEIAQQAVGEATKAQPNKTIVQISGEGLKQAAQNLAAVMPNVLQIATQIVETLPKITGA